MKVGKDVVVKYIVCLICKVLGANILVMPKTAPKSIDHFKSGLKGPKNNHPTILLPKENNPLVRFLPFDFKTFFCF